MLGKPRTSWATSPSKFMFSVNVVYLCDCMTHVCMCLYRSEEDTGYPICVVMGGQSHMKSRLKPEHPSSGEQRAPVTVAPSLHLPPSILQTPQLSLLTCLE